DLTDAMGINRPSLYAAFGNKESLFRKALDRYDEKNACITSLLSESPASAAIEKLLLKMADNLTDPTTPSGCMVVTGALSCSDDTLGIKEELAERRRKSGRLIVERLEKAQQNGELAASADPCALARYFSTVLHGMSVQASGGASREELHSVVKTAMYAWPKS
ncbi:MAG: TetR/AcrR family transcriptional regulator, partial [Alphaproteobacteria bacterium]|nr:TetR/AcrR family transcriptional regulator [Alphaproteobacteria bacterium]